MNDDLQESIERKGWAADEEEAARNLRLLRELQRRREAMRCDCDGGVGCFDDNCMFCQGTGDMLSPLPTPPAKKGTQP